MSALNLTLRPPVVTDEDRAWAIAQCPHWCVVRDDLDDDEIIDDGKPLDLEPEGVKVGAPLRKARATGTLEADGSVSYAPASIEPGERYSAPNWAAFVDERIADFERVNGHERASAENWSRRWRGWLKTADIEKRFPHSKPLTVPAAGYVFLKPGTPLHAIALGFATSTAERQVWARYGCQFVGNDTTLAAIRAAAEQREAA